MGNCPQCDEGNLRTEWKSKDGKRGLYAIKVCDKCGYSSE